MKSEHYPVQIQLPDGTLVVLGSRTLDEMRKCPSEAIQKAAEMYQKLDHAMATACVTLQRVDSSSELRREFLEAFRRELLIAAEKNKPPFWAKKWKGQRT